MSDILIIPGGSQPLHPYVKPRINGVVIVTGDGDILEAYKEQRSREIAGALRSIETQVPSMTDLYLRAPKFPDITMLDPDVGYLDGQANRRARRARERAAKKRH